MPPKKAASAASGAAPASGAKSSLQDRQHSAIMLWLTIASNRNIVMGSAGSAQNGGAMSGTAAVVPKAQGFVMMSVYVSTSTGAALSAAQAEGKYRYMLGKFTKAVSMSRASDFGVTPDDEAKGIRTIAQKLDSICPQFETWNGWFGHLQKFNPTSIMSSSGGGLEMSGDEEDGSGGNGRDVDGDGENGGEEQPEAEAEDFGERIAAVVSTGADAEIDDTAGSEVVAPPDTNGTDIQADLSPRRGSSVSRARGGSRGGGRQPALPSQPQLPPGGGLSTAATSLANLIASPNNSVASSPQSKAASFEATYASVKTSVSRDTIHSNHVLARERDVAALEQQRREHAFHAQSTALQLFFTEKSNAEERRVRQKVEFQKNCTELLLKDQSGGLVEVLEGKIDARFREPEESAATSIASVLGRFLNSYAPPPPPAE